MNTEYKDDGTVHTTISNTAKSKLLRLIKEFSPHVRMPEPTQNTSPEIWQRLVTQVCVMGSAAGMETLTDIENQGDFAEFKRATSLKQWSLHKFDVGYMASVLKEAHACRFHKKSANKLRQMVDAPEVVENGRVVLLHGLSRETPRDELRDMLLARCSNFRMKSASDLMISCNLSDDVIALDSRIIGVFRKHFSFQMTAAEIQGDAAAYVSIESALRSVCAAAGITLARLDRILFQFSGMSAVDYLLSKPTAAKG